MTKRARPDRTGVPARVLLVGEPDGWRYVIVDDAGTEEGGSLAGPGRSYPRAARTGRPEAREARLREAAGHYRARLDRLVTDLCFQRFGVDAELTWRALDDPVSWEGRVTWREPDAGRFPGRSPVLAVTLVPGAGATLPGGLPPLPLGAVRADAEAALAKVAEAAGARPPADRIGTGLGVDIGRAHLSVHCADYRDDGVDRVGAVRAAGGPAWQGSPLLGARVEGIDVLREPAADVVWLLTELGYEPCREPGDRWWFPGPMIGLSGWDGGPARTPFSEVVLWSAAFHTKRRWYRS